MCIISLNYHDFGPQHNFLQYNQLKQKLISNGIEIGLSKQLFNRLEIRLLGTTNNFILNLKGKGYKKPSNNQEINGRFLPFHYGFKLSLSYDLYTFTNDKPLLDY